MTVTKIKNILYTIAILAVVGTAGFFAFTAMTPTAIYAQEYDPNSSKNPKITNIVESSYANENDSESHDQNSSKEFVITTNNKQHTIHSLAINGTITSVKPSSGASSIIINIMPISNGILRISIPRDLIEIGWFGYNMATILRDGQEIDYKELEFNCDSRNFEIKFDKNTSKIEVIGVGTLGPGNTSPRLGSVFSYLQIEGYPVNIESEQRICNYEFVKEDKTLSIFVPTSTKTHFMKITIPKILLDGKLETLANTQQIDFELVKNEHDSVVSFNYTDADIIQIIGTSAIPEFPFVQLIVILSITGLLSITLAQRIPFIR